MQIIHISAECFPIAKVGGLADVVGALPKYQETSGISSKVIMPFYENKFTIQHLEELESTFIGEINLGEKLYNYKVLKLPKQVLGFEVFLIKIENLTDRPNVYGYPDDVERFTAFQKIVCDFLVNFKEKPNVVHCHDHHTGFIPFFMSYSMAHKKLQHIPSIITIHNAQYQGDFSYDKMYYLPDFNIENAGLIDWYGRINPLATGIKCAWKVTTVSSNYLGELQKVANGLEGLLRSEKAKSIGILNGVDSQVWNPSTDSMLKFNFNKKTINKGRQGNKEWLCNKFNLDPKLPLIAFIGRFVYEKGSDLLSEVVSQVLEKENKEVNLLLLGSGNPETENQLRELQNRIQGKFNTFIGYDEELSHIIYGGADFLLMPSRVEPCGLNQMYAMRYGMLPIVSNTGGLKDTVIDIDQGEEGFGIVLNPVNVHEICFAIQRAIDVYANKAFFKAKRKQLMNIEHSWDKSAQEYIKMYQSLVNIAQ